jgi:hypothetical protein
MRSRAEKNKRDAAGQRRVAGDKSRCTDVTVSNFEMVEFDGMMG